jgi:sigma-B regulation protein RsbU (phosphoserine phosphatase)
MSPLSSQAEPPHNDALPTRPPSIKAVRPFARHDDFADLFENAPCGYLVTDPHGRITKVNATCLRWIGWAADDLIGKRLRDLLTIQARIVYDTKVAPLLQLQSGFEDVALDMITAGGQELPVLVNASVSRDGDDELRSITIALFRAGALRKYERDLKDREAVALQSLASEKADSEWREQTIAVLGHDLRNPLAAIVVSARFLRSEVQSEKAVRVIDLMENSVDRMAGLIDNVMDFARARLGGGIGLQRAAAHLEPVLRHVVEELEAGQPGRTINCDFDLAHPIQCDAGRIGRLVSNLLGNALTHGDPKQPIRLHACATADQLELWVANAGPPIRDSAMERLFQPFFRGEARPSQQGLGLGLYIASEIAKAHGATLEVASDNEETRFTMVMPLV